MNVAVDFRNVDIVFGADQSAALSMVDKGATASAPRGEAGRQHGYHRSIVLRLEPPIRIGAPHDREKLLGLPFLRSHLGGDLLRQHVQWLLQDDQAVKLSPPYAVEQRVALDEIVA